MTATHVHGPDCAAPEPSTQAAATSSTSSTSSSSARLIATRTSAAGLLGVLAGVTVWVLARNPLRETVFPPCPLHGITGWWCPGCGATRASYLLLRGDVASALHFNALWVVLAPFALYQAVAFAGEAFGVRWLRRIRLNQTVIVALIAAFLGFGIVRNLPFDAFTVLNPLGDA